MPCTAAIYVDVQNIQPGALPSGGSPGTSGSATYEVVQSNDTSIAVDPQKGDFDLSRITQCVTITIHLDGYKFYKQIDPHTGNLTIDALSFSDSEGGTKAPVLKGHNDHQFRKSLPFNRSVGDQTITFNYFNTNSCYQHLKSRYGIYLADTHSGQLTGQLDPIIANGSNQPLLCEGVRKPHHRHP